MPVKKCQTCNYLIVDSATPCSSCGNVYVEPSAGQTVTPPASSSLLVLMSEQNIRRSHIAANVISVIIVAGICLNFLRTLHSETIGHWLFIWLLHIFIITNPTVLIREFSAFAMMIALNSGFFLCTLRVLSRGKSSSASYWFIGILALQFVGFGNFFTGAYLLTALSIFYAVRHCIKYVDEKISTRIKWVLISFIFIGIGPIIASIRHVDDIEYLFVPGEPWREKRKKHSRKLLEYFY